MGLANIREHWLGLVPSMGLVVAPAVLSRRKLVPNQSSSDLSGRQSQLQALPQAQRGLRQGGIARARGWSLRSPGSAARVAIPSAFPPYAAAPRASSRSGKGMPYHPWSGRCADGLAGA